MFIKLPQRRITNPADIAGGSSVRIPLLVKRRPSPLKLTVRCTACSHENVARLNLALIAGESARSVARRFGLNKSAVVRHLWHLPRTLVEARARSEISRADMLIGQVCKIQRQAENILKKATAEGEIELALRAIRELVRIADLSLRTLQLHENQHDKSRGSEDVPEVIDDLVVALQPYPQARAAAAQVLLARDDNVSA